MNTSYPIYRRPCENQLLHLCCDDLNQVFTAAVFKMDLNHIKLVCSISIQILTQLTRQHGRPRDCIRFHDINIIFCMLLKFET